MKTQFKFPDKTLSGAPSLIRAVADKGKGIPGFTSLAIGNPAPEAIPVSTILAAANEVLSGNPMDIMQYGIMTGYPALREMTIKRLTEVKHIPPENKGLIVTVGSGQALGLVPRSICKEGDEVFSDQYAFTNALNAIRFSGCKLTGIAMDEEGMIPEALEEAAKSGKGKYIYLIPNFQNPTSITLTLQRRKDLYGVARKYDLLIYEDDPYGELRFKGEHVPCMASFDEDGRVLYAGSYSKILSAGLRVGYLYGNKNLTDKIQNLKNATDGQSPMMTQMIVEKSIARLDMPTYLNDLCKLYGHKCETMLEALRNTCADDVKITEPEGGMFIWVTLPERLPVDEFSERCIANGVGIVKSAGFAADVNKPGNSFRINFTSLPIEQNVKAVEIIGNLTRDGK